MNRPTMSANGQCLSSFAGSHWYLVSRGHLAPARRCRCFHGCSIGDVSVRQPMGWVRLPRSSAPSSTSGALCRSNSTWRVVNHAFYTVSERINLRHSAGNAFRWDVAVGSNRGHCGRSQRGLCVDPSREYPPKYVCCSACPLANAVN